MKRLIAFSLPVLLAFGAAAQIRQSPAGPPGPGPGQDPSDVITPAPASQPVDLSAAVGIPLYPGAEAGEAGGYRADGSLRDISERYRAQLQAQGYEVRVIEQSRRAETWEVSQGDRDARVTLRAKRGEVSFSYTPAESRGPDAPLHQGIQQPDSDDQSEYPPPI